MLVLHSCFGPLRFARWRERASLAGIILSTGLLIVGCGGQPPASTQTPTPREALQVSLDFRPNPIRLGPEQLTASVTDSSGKPVTGARVTIITSTPVMKPNIPMKAAGMGLTGNASRARELGGGKYVLAIVISQPAFWHFAVRAETKNASGAALYHAEVTSR